LGDPGDISILLHLLAAQLKTEKILWEQRLYIQLQLLHLDLGAKRYSSTQAVTGTIYVPSITSMQTGNTNTDI